MKLPFMRFTFLLALLPALAVGQVSSSSPAIVEAPEYYEINARKVGTISMPKLAVRVIVREAPKQEALKALAEKVCAAHECKTKYKASIVWVYLPGMKTDSMAWAVAKFEPELNLSFTGKKPSKASLKISDREYRQKAIALANQAIEIIGDPNTSRNGFMEGTDANKWLKEVEMLDFLYPNNHRLLREAIHYLKLVPMEYVYTIRSGNTSGLVQAFDSFDYAINEYDERNQ